MRVSEAMTRDVRVATPGQTIRDAAKTMAEIDAGVLPVGENDRLIGMITDRDIAIRGVAAGKGPDTPVRDVMSTEVKYCSMRARSAAPRFCMTRLRSSATADSTLFCIMVRGSGFQSPLVGSWNPGPKRRV